VKSSAIDEPESDWNTVAFGQRESGSPLSIIDLASRLQLSIFTECWFDLGVNRTQVSLCRVGTRRCDGFVGSYSGNRLRWGILRL